MDMRRMQSVLTSEQQRQIAGVKKRDERKMERERQMKNIEKKENKEKTNEEFDKTFGQMKSTYDICRKKLNEYQTIVVVERDILKRELENVQNEKDVLLGKHIVKTQQMRNEDKNLFDTTEELQFYYLQKQEELITIKVAERDLQHFIKILKEQKLQDFISSQGVTWKFIIERVP
ncbi:rab GTPase-binding effector protein 1 [Caerostris darwini]|uniref:Rab GTPase-binding effector protein 1 n=1 Tax=Caerostris darwini TaxID=1538125 RepID=A0AAV4QEE5_9ARAC|nr:rab GTPase-binding effector protein 1 [Caerostris darwini]